VDLINLNQNMKNGGFFKAQQSGNAKSVQVNKATALAIGRSNVCPNV
jgi:hypothetical protein